MVLTDPIADMLTRIRNGLTARKDVVEIPASKTKNSILNILVEEGYIKKAELIEGEIQGTLKVTLKYGPNNEKVITGLKRISKPGLRVYADSEKLPKVLNGMGIAIVSTNKGIMTDKEARAGRLGGEVLAFVW